MTIQIIDGFYIDIDRSQRVSVGIESKRIMQCLSHAREISAYGVYGHPPHGFLENNLDFLSELKNIQSISFISNDGFKNIDGIYSLINLKEIGIFEKRPSLNFHLLEKMEVLNISHHKKDKGMNTLKKLHTMHFWHHKSKDGTFSNIEFPESLEKLSINWSNVTSLNEIYPLINLKELEIHRCQNMKDLSNLKIIAPNLEKLKIDTSKSIKFEALEIDSLLNLKSISINRKTFR